MKIINVVGARPNFIKISPLIKEMNNYPNEISHILVHTGQHYDDNLSKDFFDILNIPMPDIEFNIGSGSHAEQTARIMVEFEKVCVQEKPDLVVVVGDVNSTMACAITAKKMGIKVAHVEAGLRSGDMTMPEEINRLCTDAIADYLFTTDKEASDNLRNEGITDEKIFFVGNVMIDTLLKHANIAKDMNIYKTMGLKKNKYVTLTIHRPSNVDDRNILKGIIEALESISKHLPIIFPAHPRTSKLIKEFGFSDYFQTLIGESVEEKVKGIFITQPLGYLEFLNLNMNAKMVLTDSGGLQEETTALKIPCITIRNNTERPITINEGTNSLAGNNKENIIKTAMDVFNRKTNEGKIPEYWDGSTSKRIINIILGN